MKRLLFFSTKNSIRSLMAEIFARQMGPEGLEILSAGFTAGQLDPYANIVMSEIGFNISNHKTRSINELDSSGFKFIITFCEDLREKWFAPPGNPCIINWNVPEPAAEGAAEEDVLASYRNTRDTIRRLTEDFFSHGYYKTIHSLKSSLDAVMQTFIDGVIVHDNNRTISQFNKAAERITGWKAAEVLGRDCRTVFPNGFCGDKCNFCEMKQKKIMHLIYPIEITARDGTRKSIMMSVMPLMDENDKQAGVIASFRDITRVVELEMKLSESSPFPGIISTSKEMQSVFSLIRDVKGSDVPVLIQGETGTGKELIAQAIHKESRRADMQFVPVNCGALPEGTIESELFGHVKGAFTGAIRDKKGRFELARGGTIFLDEIGELSPAMQVKLLRVLQEGTFEPVGGEETIKTDVRVISATNRDLNHMIKTGGFREDLYYRLCVVPVKLPPLRERKSDILPLVSYFLESISKQSSMPSLQLSELVKQIFIEYKWPGNIRQLQNALQFAVLKCKGDTIETHHLPHEIVNESDVAARKSGPGRKKLLDEASVADALKQAGGNKAKAARILGVDRATLYRFL